MNFKCRFVSAVIKFDSIVIRFNFDNFETDWFILIEPLTILGTVGVKM